MSFGIYFHIKLIFLKRIIDKLGNARVKLQSQVHFESKKILGPKECWVQKSFNSKKIWVLS